MSSAQNMHELADVETSSEDYASRFAGPTGAWLLKRQEHIVLNLLEPFAKAHVLDVGGGHAQLVAPLLTANHHVTVLGSSAKCQARLAPWLQSSQCAFQVGNLLKAPFPDKSFDVVTCIRFISHCDQPEVLVSELCRLARRAVILDYPPLWSFNLSTPLLFHLKKVFEKNTRHYCIFTHTGVRRHFARNGFKEAARHGQFFLPMVVHRALKNPGLSENLEMISQRLGLNDLFGSPVLARYEPRSLPSA